MVLSPRNTSGYAGNTQAWTQRRRRRIQKSHSRQSQSEFTQGPCGQTLYVATKDHLALSYPHDRASHDTADEATVSLVDVSSPPRCQATMSRRMATIFRQVSTAIRNISHSLGSS
ncbi:hypothetical protein J3459_005989 [Metarhizium acridum]|nr:hypothetical protein J3459_005989 [Metarhizium acridum]